MKPIHNAAVARTFDAYPPTMGRKLMVLRQLIFDTAATTDGVGEIEEVLKWGEPAYLTAQTKSGSTIRIDWKKSTPSQYAIYFHCQTTLVSALRVFPPHSIRPSIHKRASGCSIDLSTLQRCCGSVRIAMATVTTDGCGCPPSAPAVPSVNGVHHVFLTVNDLSRSRAFYAVLMPRLGYPGVWDYEDAPSVGFLGAGGSFWLKQAAPQHANETFSKDRVGLCEVAFRAETRAQVDAIARDLPEWGGTILDPPREYPHYVPGYYAVFFADPDGIKLEVVHIPG